MPPKELTRRRAVELIAVTASGVFLARPLLAQTADTSRLIPGAGVCVLTPETTAGPFYFDPKLVRADIREDRKGVPVTVRLQVVDETCQPIPKARADIWHCDAGGAYSNYGPRGRATSTTETFLRGTQIADANGIVDFVSIYPGWYPGRTTHIHFKIFVSDRDVLTGHIFFPDALSEFIYRNVPPYSDRAATRDMLNNGDFIARQATRASFAHVKEQEADYLVSLIVGIDPAGRSTGRRGSGPPTPRSGSGSREDSLVPGVRD